MDGLNYNDAETVTKMIQTGASQHSYAAFDATNNISVTNSSFSDMTWGNSVLALRIFRFLTLRLAALQTLEDQAWSALMPLIL